MGIPVESDRVENALNSELSTAQRKPALLVDGLIPPKTLFHRNIPKRKSSDFVAALLDWRLFENPYLLLSDIEVPVTKFRERNELEGLLPELFDKIGRAHV